MVNYVQPHTHRVQASITHTCHLPAPQQRDLEEQLQQEKLAKLQAYHAAVVKRAAVVQKDMQIRKMQLHKEVGPECEKQLPPLS